MADDSISVYMMRGIDYDASMAFPCSEDAPGGRYDALGATGLYNMMIPRSLYIFHLAIESLVVPIFLLPEPFECAGLCDKGTMVT